MITSKVLIPICASNPPNTLPNVFIFRLERLDLSLNTADFLRKMFGVAVRAFRLLL